MTRNETGSVITRLRTARGMSAAALASKMRQRNGKPVLRSTLYKIEDGSQELTFFYAVQVCDALGVRLEELLMKG